MSKRTKFESYITKEIGIEFKACLYFFCILTFHCFVLVMQGMFQVSILTMIEMILTNYIICYLQVLLFHNFDEAEKLGGKEAVGILVCTGIYTAVSYFLNWFGRRADVSVCFMVFMLLSYLCVYLVYKTKRTIDSRELNNLLREYKKRNGVENGRSDQT